MIFILLNSREKLSMYESVWQGPNDLMNCFKCGALLPFGQHTTEHNEKFADIIAYNLQQQKKTISNINHFFIHRENEANKRKLQQIQIKLDETQTKEQGTLGKLQECIQIVEQSQFERNEVKVFFEYT